MVAAPGARTLLKVGSLLAVALLLGGCLIPPEPETTEAKATFGLYVIVLIMAAVVFVGVEGFILYSVFRYRRRDDRLPAQLHGNNLVEVIWTVIPTVIVVVLFVLSISTLGTVQATTDKPAVVVEVDGFQWQWTFRYRDDDNNPDNDYVGHRQRRPAAGHGAAGGRADPTPSPFPGRDPLVLRAALPDQEGPRSRAGGTGGEPARVHDHGRGHLRRAMRRVLRQRACRHALHDPSDASRPISTRGSPPAVPAKSRRARTLTAPRRSTFRRRRTSPSTPTSHPGARRAAVQHRLQQRRRRPTHNVAIYNGQPGAVQR